MFKNNVRAAVATSLELCCCLGSKHDNLPPNNTRRVGISDFCQKIDFQLGKVSFWPQGRTVTVSGSFHDLPY